MSVCMYVCKIFAICRPMYLCMWICTILNDSDDNPSRNYDDRHISFNFIRHVNTVYNLYNIQVFFNNYICRLIFQVHIYKYHISCLIFSEHIHVTQHHQICRLKTTTSQHTVKVFHSRRCFPAHNIPIHVIPCTCWFQISLLFWYLPCVTYSQTNTLNVPGVPCHWIPKQVDDGPLCGHTMPDRRSFKFDIFLLVKFIIFLSIPDFFLIAIPEGAFVWPLFGCFREGPDVVFAGGTVLHCFMHHVHIVPGKNLENLVPVDDLVHIAVQHAILLYHIDTTMIGLDGFEA